MTIYYIDSRASGANNGDAGGVTGPDGNGIYQDAWQTIAAAELAKPYVSGDEIQFVVGSGPYRENLTLGKNGASGTPILWRTTVVGEKVEVSAGDDLNTAAYQWTASGSGTNEYYLEAAGGGTPGIVEPKSATVDGYVRIESAEADRQRQAAGSLDNLSWGWGDNDALGYSTMYVRVDSGAPATVEIVASQRGQILSTNWRYHEFEDLVFSYGNSSNVYVRGWEWVFRRCAYLFADSQGVSLEGTDASVRAWMISCVFYWPGHRAVSIEGNANCAGATYNCTFYEPHLYALLNTTGTGTLTAVNNILVGGEAGAMDKKLATGTFIESHNLWYPRMTAAGGDLGYVSSSNWATTDPTDVPGNSATNLNAARGGLGRSNYAGMKDPKLSKVLANDFSGSDFSIPTISPATSAGIDWWTAIGEPAPLDYYGNPVNAADIHLGAAQELFFAASEKISPAPEVQMLPARTNSVVNNTFSEIASATDFDDWTEAVSGTSTVTQETSDLPSGYTTGLRIETDGSNSYAYCYQKKQLSVGSGGVATLSSQIKAASSTGLKFSLRADDGAGGSVEYLNAAGSAWQAGVVEFEPSDLPTSWAHWEVTLPPTNSGRTHVWLNTVSRNSGANSTHRITGLQLEPGLKATPTIITTTAAVARAKDEIQIADFDTWANATEGVIVLAITPSDDWTVSAPAQYMVSDADSLFVYRNAAKDGLISYAGSAATTLYNSNTPNDEILAGVIFSASLNALVVGYSQDGGATFAWDPTPVSFTSFQIGLGLVFGEVINEPYTMRGATMFDGLPPGSDATLGDVQDWVEGIAPLWPYIPPSAEGSGTLSVGSIYPTSITIGSLR